VVFKDLQKLLQQQKQQQQQQRGVNELFESLQNKLFWIWNVEEHKLEDARTNGDCCLNRIIGLPQKDGNDKPIYDYEKIIFDTLVTKAANRRSRL
jgi:hypothetical protein